VVSEPRRGEVWWGEDEGTGRRPYLVMTRNGAIPRLPRLLVAPVTRTVRGISTEVPLDRDDGLPVSCAATFDNLRVFPKALLVERIATLHPIRMVEACRALRHAVDC
jgi:mRNA interferase MazF